MQTLACEDSSVMMRLLLVKGAMMEAKVNDDVLHGEKVTLGIVQSRVDSNRVICANTHFASVATTELLHLNGS